MGIDVQANGNLIEVRFLLLKMGPAGRFGKKTEISFLDQVIKSVRCPAPITEEATQAGPGGFVKLFE